VTAKYGVRRVSACSREMGWRVPERTILAWATCLNGSRRRRQAPLRGWRWSICAASLPRVAFGIRSPYSPPSCGPTIKSLSRSSSSVRDRPWMCNSDCCLGIDLRRQVRRMTDTTLKNSRRCVERREVRQRTSACGVFGSVTSGAHYARRRWRCICRRLWFSRDVRPSFWSWTLPGKLDASHETRTLLRGD